MITLAVTLTARCDAAGCGRTQLVFRWEREAEMPMPTPPTLPEGWRARVSLHRTQHACSAECERALIDAEALTTPARRRPS